VTDVALALLDLFSLLDARARTRSEPRPDRRREWGVAACTDTVVVLHMIV
jgi:hypothetical protein